MFATFECPSVWSEGIGLTWTKGNMRRDDCWRVAGGVVLFVGLEGGRVCFRERWSKAVRSDNAFTFAWSAVHSDLRT